MASKSNVSRSRKPAPKGVFPKTAEPANDALDVAEMERAVLNAPAVGRYLSIGDLIMEALAPEVIVEESHPHACEPPEATILRQLGMELSIMADALESKEPEDYVDLPTVLRTIAKRTIASEELMRRLRDVRFGTSYTWGGVAAKVTP